MDKVDRNTLYQREFRKRMSVEDRKAYDKARYKRYKEKYNINSKNWAKENPHKSHASTHQTTLKKRYPEIWERSNIETKDLAEWLKQHRGDPCPYCGEEAFHIDHMTPLSKGGEHTWDNIELICKTCNIAKNNLTKQEYINWIKNLIHFQELSNNFVV